MVNIADEEHILDISDLARKYKTAINPTNPQLSEVKSL
jgi:hypothetical protein